MKIEKLYAIPGLSGQFNKDLQAMREGRESDGLFYLGQPVTEGFDAIVQPGYSISILLRLDDGQLAWGDCVDAILAGGAGRDKVFLPKEHLKIIENEISDYFVGKEISSFRDIDTDLEKFEVKGRKLHMAVRYGLSQALLDAIAKANHITITEVIAKEYGLAHPCKKVPIAIGGTRGDQKLTIDKAILREVDYLPHAVFNNVERDFGLDGKKFLEYVLFVRERIQKFGRHGYKPTLHFDLYGTLGQAFHNNMSSIIVYLQTLKNIAEPYNLVLEAPIIAETQTEQLLLFRELKKALKKAKLNIMIIVDEWCNTLEDIKLFADLQVCDFIKVKAPDLGIVSKSIEASLYCKGKGIGVIISGSTNGTDQSARIDSHIALATQADILSEHPGQNVDAGLMILSNEMLRTLRLIKS